MAAVVPGSSPLYKQSQSLDCGYHYEQTKPIPGGRNTPPRYCSIIPPFESGAYRATSPRCPASGNKANFDGGRIAAKPFAGIALCRMYPTHRFGKTKPIPPGLSTRVGWANCAKQTQFPPPCRSADRRSQGPSAPNKANFGVGGIAAKAFTGIELCHMYPARRFGKTKPIPTPGSIRRPAFPGAVRATSPQCPVPFRQQTQLPEAGHRDGVGPLAARTPTSFHYSIVPVFQGDL